MRNHILLHILKPLIVEGGSKELNQGHRSQELGRIGVSVHHVRKQTQRVASNSSDWPIH